MFEQYRFQKGQRVMMVVMAVVMMVMVVVITYKHVYGDISTYAYIYP